MHDLLTIWAWDKNANQKVNRTGDTGVIPEEVSTKLRRHDAAGYHHVMCSGVFDMKKTILSIFILCFTFINLGCSKESSHQGAVQIGNRTDALFAFQIEEYSTREFDIILDSEITESQFNDFKFLLSRRISCLVSRERMSKAYDQLTGDINSRFDGKIFAKRAPEGIKIKFVEIPYNSKSKEEMNDKYHELKEELFEKFPFLEELVFDKKRGFLLREFSMTTIISFKNGIQEELTRQTISKYDPYFKKRIIKNSNSSCRVQVPSFIYAGISEGKFICASGLLSIYEVTQSRSKDRGQENLPLKISDSIKDKIPPQRLDVIKINDLNKLIASVEIEKDTRFNSWYVTVQLTEEGSQFYKEETARLLTERAAFVLDSGFFWERDRLGSGHTRGKQKWNF